MEFSSVPEWIDDGGSGGLIFDFEGKDYQITIYSISWNRWPVPDEVSRRHHYSVSLYNYSYSVFSLRVYSNIPLYQAIRAYKKENAQELFPLIVKEMFSLLTPERFTRLCQHFINIGKQEGKREMQEALQKLIGVDY